MQFLQNIQSHLDKGTLSLRKIRVQTWHIEYIEKIVNKYLSGTDMTYEEVWKTNKPAGDIFTVIRSLLQYIKVTLYLCLIILELQPTRCVKYKPTT